MMTTTVTERLRQHHCDVDAAIQRMGTGEMYDMLVQSFVKDKSLTLYLDAFQQQDYETAYRHVHSMKGLSASFGFTALNQVACRITDALRAKNYALTAQMNDELIRQQKDIIAIITGA